MNGNNDTPDKRTTAYENIFGRPTAKPKGPNNAYPVPNGGLPPGMSVNPAWTGNQQAYMAGQPMPRYNGNNSMVGPSNAPYRTPQQMYTYQQQQNPALAMQPSDAVDRRTSLAPSVTSNDNRTSTYFAGSSAADAYGGPSGQVGYPVQANAFLRANSTSPAPAQRILPSVQGAYTSASLRHPSESSLPPYIRQPSGPTSVSPPVLETSSGNNAPRLPSFDLGGSQGTHNEENWFTNGSGVAAIDLDGKNGATVSPPLASTSRVEGIPQSPSGQTDGGVDDADMFATGDEGMYRNDYQDYQRQLHEQQSQSRTTSLLRQNSVESDRRSVATSQYNVAGPTSASSRMYYAQGGGGGSATASGYFPPPAPLTQYTADGNASNWARQPRMRTASSATTQAISHRESNADWRRSAESGSTAVAGGATGARSMSFGQQSAPKQGMIISPHGSIASGPAALSAANNRRGPLVYPALLSKVAEAFKHRVAVSERQKDGLAYTDAFDGREAVDKIAYIIKTTDRNLALLLGRALDAQKFFHDVTYDHRLRDSPNELYQFRVRLTSPFGSEAENFEDAVEYRPNNNKLGIPDSKGVTRDNSTSTMQDGDKLDRLSPSIQQQLTPSTLAEEEEDALPTGVFTLLTDCYSPTCTRDRLCYSIACPRRLEQQARLNMKPQPGLKRSISKESLGDVKEPGALWAESVSADVLKSVSDGERKRQELINEVIYTERDFVRDIEYLRDSWIKPLRSRDVIPEARREDFVTQVFWNVLEIHTVNSKLAEMLTKRQKQQDIVDRIGDILLEMVPHFGPFVKYGAHQLYGKYEFEKEKSSNPAFAKFVDETERLPESRKLELNGYLTKPTTRLARYPLLLEAVIKATPDDNPDKQALPKVVKIVKEFLSKVNTESGKSENRFNLAQLDQQLVFKQGEAVDLRLRDEQRELVFKGPLKKRGGAQSESAELQVFLFDHAMLMVKAKTVHKNDLYKVFRKPIPLELLIVTVYDEVPTGKGNATRPKSVMSKTSTGNRLSGQVPTGSAPKQDVKTGYALTFTYLGRKGYSQTLWASTFVSRKKWFENIETRQEILRQRSNIFDTITLAEGFFNGPSRVTCSVPFDFGRRIIYGADDGVYLSDLRERARPPTKVLPLPGVTQVDVLEEYQILIILAEKSVHTFTLDALDPTDPVGSLKRGRRISSHTSFFKAGQCLGRTLVCVVKSSSLSSTIKTLEPIEQNLRVGKKQQTFRKLLQGGQDTLRVFKEFYIPTESSSIHFLKTKLCVGCTKGFEIVDLETLDTQGLLDPADSNLDFVQKKENVKPIAIYRIDGEFLLCYDEFAFYVNKNGWRSKGNWIIHWEGNPTAFALHHPYVLAFEPSFIEVRHVTTGALHQVITGYNLRCLFADVPPPSSGGASSSNSSANSSSATLHAGMAGLVGGMSPYGVRPPMHYAIGAPPYSALARQQSFNVMGQVPPPPPPSAPQMAGQSPQQPAYLGRSSTSSIPPNTFAQANIPPQIAPGQAHQPQSLPPHMYSRPPPLAHHHTSPGMPYSPYGQGPVVAPRQPSTQRNPVWESVAASRNQIVFIGDTTVFCVRPAGPSSPK